MLDIIDTGEDNVHLSRASHWPLSQRVTVLPVATRLYILCKPHVTEDHAQLETMRQICEPYTKANDV